MSTSNETTNTTTETLIKFDHKALLKRSTKSSTKSLSLKPSRSFGRVKSLRPKSAALGTKKDELGVTES
mgnify:CR=1 FL=1